MRLSISAVLIFGLFVFADAIAAEPEIVLESPTCISVTNLSQDDLLGLSNESFRVYVAGASEKIPVLGSVEGGNQSISFTPRFPLRPDVSYQVEFKPLKKVATLKLPTENTLERAKLEAIYPSAAVLPENQLKLYLLFTAPMGRGDCYRNVQLLDEHGKPVELPFLEIGEELWDHEQKRLTLLLDPGRIKRGLKPNKEVGPPLMNGHSYTLVINKAWLDAKGHPLAQEYRKAFRVGPFDSVQPNPERWQILPPNSKDGGSLRVTIDEPLDYALLSDCLKITYTSGSPIPGKQKIGDGEISWQFFPEKPFTRGMYVILIDTKLEDLAGNSIQRPFEVDLSSQAETPVPDRLKMTFEVR